MKLRKHLLRLAGILSACLLNVATPARAQAFQHPGVLVSRGQLDYMKAMVQAHVEPFYSTFVKAQNSTWGSLNYVPIGPPSGGYIQCGSTSTPDIGCSDSDNDATAAYTQALLWYITGNQVYAQNSIKIMDLYAQNLKGYDTAYSNAPLQAAWDGEKWPRAAEIIRYSNAGWTDAEITQFKAMLVNAILPRIQAGSTSNGNWEISMIESLMGIGVFNDDQTTFNTGVTYWKQRIPAYFYYHTDGSTYIPAPRGTANWYGQTVFDPSVDGVSQETCRDFGHAQYSIAGTLNAAETARIQGVDLYTPFQARLMAMMEFHAYYQLQNPVPTSVCGGTVTLQLNPPYPTYEIGYNEFHNRLGQSLPYTLQYLNQVIRPDTNPVDYHMMVYESLTHGGDASSLPAFLLWTSDTVSTLKAGTSGTYTTTVIAGASSTSNVSLSVTGLPTGVSASFNTTVVTGSGASTLTLTTSSTAAPGVFPLTITGSAGNSTYTNALTLTINSANADYGLAVSPNPVSIVTGGVAQYTASLTPINSYRGSVTLSASGLPTGMSASFSPKTVDNNNTSSTLTLTSDGTTPPGAYSFTITGNDKSTTHTASAALIVNSISSGCVTQLGNYWINGVLATQVGAFTAEWDATPSTVTNNSNVGLSLGAQTAFTGLAVSARFNTTGTIDARNAAAFASDNVIPYSAGMTYHFRTVVNVPANTYSLYVTPAGGTEITVGSKYAFRTEQAGIASIDHWDAISQAGTINLCNLVIDSTDFGLQITPASGAVQAGTTSAYTATITPRGGFAGMVALSASGLPPGATASFNPASLNAQTTSSTVTVSTTAATVAGVYTMAVQGVSGALSHTIYTGLTITPACIAPAANAENVTVAQNSSTPVTLSATLGANCAGTDVLTYAIVTPPSHGVLTGTTPYLTYTPTQGYTGPDSFTFTASDKSSTPATSNAAQVSITVQALSSNTPAITSLSPANTNAGNAAFSLAVNGAGFTPGSTVLWNGTARTTTFISATQLTASISANDVATSGITEVSVQTASGTSVQVEFSVDTSNSVSGRPTLVAPTTAAVVTHGQGVNVYLSLTNALPALTSLACYNLPTGTNCSFNAATSVLTITADSNTSLGSYSALLVATTKASAQAGFAGSRFAAFCAALLSSLMFFGVFRQRKRLRWLPLLGVLLISLAGCADGTAATGSPNVAGQASTTMTVTVK